MGREETVISQLAELYESYGYSYYKVSRFEEYDLYARNRNFLSGGQILTFNDADGRLMALKPDVTLSIVKNTKDDEGMKKIYYKENVYRVPRSGSGFKEIMQSGLECIGDIDRYATGEVIMLAASSLESVSSEYILDISHIGITAGILEGTDDETADAILKAMSEKNAPMLEKICEKDRLPQEKKQLLEQLIRLYEPIGTGIERLKNMELPKECREAVTELEELCDVLKLYGIDKNRIAVGGDSAGGNLALSTAIKARNSGLNWIKALVLAYPCTVKCDATMDGYVWSEDVYDFSEEQAEAIVTLQLYRLTNTDIVTPYG